MKDHRIVLLAAAIYFGINTVMFSVLPLYVLKVSGDEFLVGLTIAIPYMLAVPMSFIWGFISDRIGSRRKVLAAGGLIGALFFFAFPFVDLPGLLALRCVQAAALSSYVLLYALMTEFMPKMKGRSVGSLSLVGGIGAAIGATIAGLLLPMRYLTLGSWQVSAFFFVCGALMIVYAGLLMRVREPQREDAQGHNAKELAEKKIAYSNIDTTGPTPAGGFLTLGAKTLRHIALLGFVGFLVNLAILIILGTFSAYLAELTDPSDTAWVIGIFYASSSLTGILAAYMAGQASDRFGRRWILIGSSVWYIAVWAFMGATTNILLLGILWAMPVWQFYYVSITAKVADMTSEKQRGGGIGFLNSAMNLGAFLGSLASGVLLASGRPDLIFLGATVISIAAALLCLASRETLPGIWQKT